VTLIEAARALGISPSTLRRWCAQGCPHQPGRRGNGGAARYDPELIRRWRAGDLEVSYHALAAELHQAAAGALFEQWRAIEGPSKRRDAGLVAACWFIFATATTDVLRQRDSTIAEPRLPSEIRHLRQIAHNVSN